MKIKWMTGAMAVLLCTFFFWQMTGIMQSEQTASVLVSGISRGVVCKSLALSLTDPSVCSQANQGILMLSDREDWYAPYYAYLYEQGIVTEQLITPSRIVMETGITTGELKYMLGQMQLTELAERYLQAEPDELVDKELFWELYQKILESTDVTGEVTELVIQIYGTAANLTDAVAWQCYTSEGVMGFSGLALDYYIDSWIRVLQRDHEIIVVLGETESVQLAEESESPLLADASGIPMIRVLLNNSNYTSCYHPYVELTCRQNWLLQKGEVFEEIPAGEVVHLEPGDERFAFGTITAHAVQDEIAVLNIQRSLGTPSYGGKLEITEDGQGLLIVNELPIESYLVKVVPSEMPSRYGIETAKIQAVCARSYAIRQIQQNACRAYRAHVDDSTAFQVYNNVPSQPISQQAVEETEGEVLTDAQGNVLSAYYFSTSCGYTTDITSWNADAAIPAYLEMKEVKQQPERMDIRNEDVFQSVIMDWNHPGYELGMVWYRWKYKCSLETLGETIEDRLPAVIAQCGQMIWMERDGELLPADLSIQLGALQDIQVIQRGSGGIVQEVALTGSEAVLHVYGQTAIRKLLAAPDYMYDNGSEEGRSHSESTLLPSGFFCLQPVWIETEKEAPVIPKETVTSKDTLSSMESERYNGYVFWGGGNGHGIGMSQNGAYAMTQAGMNYQEVLQFFYKGSEIRKITENFAQS